jgi:hypothetical protein
MAAVVWDKQKTYQLILLLELSPALWYCTLQEYRDRQVKAKCMETIIQKLEITSAEVRRKLHHLWCQMNSEFRRIKNKKSGAGADKTVKFSWEFFFFNQTTHYNCSCNTFAVQHFLYEEILLPTCPNAISITTRYLVYQV